MRFLAVVAVAALLAAPQVAAEVCASVKPPANGGWTAVTDGLGGTGKLACNANFEVTGNPNIVCGFKPNSNEVDPKPVWLWQDAANPGRCVALCPSINAPSNGQWEHVTGNHVGDTGNLACSPGFVLKGDAGIKCLPNGSSGAATWQWSGHDGSCVAVDCPAISPPDHGSWASVVGGVGGTGKLVCDSGYSVQGNPNIACTLNDDQHSATWKWTNNNQAATCQPARCPPVPPPSNGQWASVSGDDIGATGTAVCNNGFTLSGNPGIVCKLVSANVARWEWIDNNSPASCPKIVCPVVNPPVGGQWVNVVGTIGGTGQVQCNENFTLFGGKDIKCVNAVNGGAWIWVNDKIGYCVPNHQ